MAAELPQLAKKNSHLTLEKPKINEFITLARGGSISKPPLYLHKLNWGSEGGGRAQPQNWVTTEQRLLQLWNQGKQW